MSADLAIIALPDTEPMRAMWRRLQAVEAVGDDIDAVPESWMTPDEHREAMEVLLSHPNIEVGQLSTLSAAILGDSGRYIPGPIDRVMDLVGDAGMVLTPGAIKELMVAFNLPNTSNYGHLSYHRVTDQDEIRWYRRVTRTPRGRRTYGRFREPNIVQYGKGRGLIARQHLKVWLNENAGARLVYLVV